MGTGDDGSKAARSEPRRNPPPGRQIRRLPCARLWLGRSCEADSEGDLDFPVDLECGRSLRDLGGLQFELESLLRRPVDVVTERGLKARLRERALRDTVPV